MNFMEYFLFRVSLSDNEISKSLNQIISYLEYLRFESLRHLYLINSFYESENTFASSINFGSASEVSRSQAGSDQRACRKNEIREIIRDIDEIENTITRLSQKYFVFIPDIGWLDWSLFFMYKFSLKTAWLNLSYNFF